MIDMTHSVSLALDRLVCCYCFLHDLYKVPTTMRICNSRFRLATGVSKFTEESKPETWLEDYRVAVQIGGGNDEVVMKHLPLMLEGSARAWLNQLTPSSIYTWEDHS